MFRERKVTADGLALNVASGPPNGPPLVLLHGVGRRWQDFVPLLPFLVNRWEVHAVDFRGHGRSDRGPGYRVADYLHDVANLLPELGDEPAAIYGHSLGGLVALAVAVEHPARARGLVLEDPPAESVARNFAATPYGPLFRAMQAMASCGQPIKDVAERFAGVLLPAAGGGTVRLGDVRDAASVRFSARCLLDLDPAVMAPVLDGRWLDGLELPALAGKVACPALLLRGDEVRGGMLPRADADALAGAMADCSVVDVPAPGHLIHWLEPATAGRLAAGFLESL